MSIANGRDLTVLAVQAAPSESGLLTADLQQITQQRAAESASNPMPTGGVPPAHAAEATSRVFNINHVVSQILDPLDEQDDAYCTASSCLGFHTAIRERFPDGTHTGPSGVFSSIERFMWAYTELPVEARPPWDGSNLCGMIARAGNLDALKWARANGCDWDSYTCSQAAGGGHLEVLQWLRANGCGWGYDTCTAAAGGGHLEVLQWARANGCGWDSYTCRASADGGHFEVLKWARDNGCPEF